MLTVGIAIDKWKLSIFEKHLTKNGFKFKKSKGITPDTLFLKVKVNNTEDIANVVYDAQLECEQTTATKH